MTTALTGLNLTLPVIAAPMSGGPTTVAMVIAAHRAGGLGFLATGYKTPEAVQAELDALREESLPFGVNVFVPNPTPIQPERYRRYSTAMQAEADRFGVTLPAEPVDSDDSFNAKIELLLAHPAPVVSFTFGIPPVDVIRKLQAAGSVVAQTVTCRGEAMIAAAAGADALVVQATTAGGHSGTFTPERPPEPLPIGELVASVTNAVDLPVIAAGGLGTAADIAEVLRAGASAAAVGTVLLLADESGASATHQAALQDSRRTETVVTHAFTGRPARGLRNRFTDTYTATAPYGYPALHFLTSPLRKAAAAAGDPELVHLWAGTGHRHARREPTEQILRRLAP
ncbi:NAD(P)H-dependent flavin oxidoreductase [Mycolicibacterium fortuitum]|uniref:NAD(P)H-dependent flavin oxidoreductase n=1 Tax=Mycolicibacterium fortuitum TaxID=1766 RepID=UPI0007F013FD|nr:nitronate monooxygenase [Mycolicibacterium fortuitum]MBP3082232.1 nitronate monooxygenase [Mycolicibacterium fortuitum]NOQ58642.1 nitronate monooxygenase [Mycolicibacterium fortuitum]OBK57459.1 2-nitropropane dioxygenase [Mycolicibacterium fortuitum]